MSTLNTNLHFYCHVLFFKLRDIFFPRFDIVKEAEIKMGFSVVDYGCGPGSYTVYLSQMAGNTGKIYAVDIHPLAIKKIKTLISKKHLVNVEALCTDMKTGLPDKCIDVILLYDVFHALKDSDVVLKELHRILKQEGIISFLDHRIIETEALRALTKDNYFRLLKKNEKTYTFGKVIT